MGHNIYINENHGHAPDAIRDCLGDRPEAPHIDEWYVEMGAWQTQLKKAISDTSGLPGAERQATIQVVFEDCPLTKKTATKAEVAWVLTLQECLNLLYLGQAA